MMQPDTYGTQEILILTISRIFLTKTLHNTTKLLKDMSFIVLIYHISCKNGGQGEHKRPNYCLTIMRLDWMFFLILTSIAQNGDSRYLRFCAQLVRFWYPSGILCHLNFFNRWRGIFLVHRDLQCWEFGKRCRLFVNVFILTSVPIFTMFFFTKCNWKFVRQNVWPVTYLIGLLENHFFLSPDIILGRQLTCQMVMSVAYQA